jgi:hypothetical protein
VIVFGASVGAERARDATSGLGSELTVLLSTAAVQAVLLAVLWLALSWVLPRPAMPWTALVPGSLLFAAGFLLFNLTVRLYFVPRAARASAVYGSLGVALVLLVSLFCSAGWRWRPPSSTPPCSSGDRTGGSLPRGHSVRRSWPAAEGSAPGPGGMAPPGSGAGSPVRRPATTS